MTNQTYERIANVSSWATMLSGLIFVGTLASMLDLSKAGSWWQNEQLMPALADFGLASGWVMIIAAVTWFLAYRRYNYGQK
jgi:hypothetical protein